MSRILIFLSPDTFTHLGWDSLSFLIYQTSLGFVNSREDTKKMERAMNFVNFIKWIAAEGDTNFVSTLLVSESHLYLTANTHPYNLSFQSHLSHNTINNNAVMYLSASLLYGKDGPSWYERFARYPSTPALRPPRDPKPNCGYRAHYYYYW